MLLELRFADITIKRANINISLGFLVTFLYPGQESLPRQSHEGFIHDLMESNATIIPAPIYRTTATEPCAIYHTRFDGQVLQARVLEALANNGQQGAGCVEYSHPQHDIFDSLTLFPLDFSCLCIQCLVEDENDALQFERAPDLERLHQNLVNGSHVSSRCVNSRQISDDIL